MELLLFKSILSHLLENKSIEISFPDLKASISELFQNTCYLILQQIQTVITDDELSDEECFNKIEKIINIFEKYDISNGIRHDF